MRWLNKKYVFSHTAIIVLALAVLGSLTIGNDPEIPEPMQYSYPAISLVKPAGSATLEPQWQDVIQISEDPVPLGDASDRLGDSGADPGAAAELKHYAEKGNNLYQEGRIKAALDPWSYAITLDQEQALLYYNRGIGRAQLGETEGALEDFIQAVQLEPKDPAIHNSLGSLYYQMGEYEQAVLCYDQAILINPRDAVPFLNRSNANRQLKNYNLALDDLDRAIRLDPSLTEAYRNRGGLFFVLGDYGSALADFDEVVNREPADPVSRFNRGLVHLQFGNYPQAERDFGFVIQKDPEQALPYDLLARAAYQNRNFTKAAAYWEEYLKRAPDSASDARVAQQIELCKQKLE